MVEYYLGEFKVLAPKKMLVGITEDKKRLIAVDGTELEVHCIIEYINEKLNVKTGWNINYTVSNSIISLNYNFERD